MAKKKITSSDSDSEEHEISEKKRVRNGKSVSAEFPVAPKATISTKSQTETMGTLDHSTSEDHLAILQLLHKYCHTVDRGTVDEIAALFHRDAVLLPKYESDVPYIGREAVRGWYAEYDRKLRSRVRFLRHKIECPLIEIKGNEATSVCYLDADAITISVNEPWMVVGRYEDKLIKEEGHWWFKERTIMVYYTYPLTSYRPGR